MAAHCPRAPQKSLVRIEGCASPARTVRAFAGDNEPMTEPTTSSAPGRRLSRPVAVAVVLLLIAAVAALFGIWNEIRYQGCVQRIDREIESAALTHQPATGLIRCHRLPIVH